MTSAQKPHEYGDSFTGMLCGAMVTLEDGSGDQCGLPSSHPIHAEWRLRQKISNAIGYDRVPVSIDGHPEIHWTFRTVDDRDQLVDRITAALL